MRPSTPERSPWSGSPTTGGRCSRAMSDFTSAKRSGPRGWSETYRDSRASCRSPPFTTARSSIYPASRAIAASPAPPFKAIWTFSRTRCRVPPPRISAAAQGAGTRHPKLYWIDPGLVRAVKKLHGPIAPEERGALLEGWVLHLLRAHGEQGGRSTSALLGAAPGEPHRGRLFAPPRAGRRGQVPAPLSHRHSGHRGVARGRAALAGQNPKGATCARRKNESRPIIRHLPINLP